jgi:3-deoxy-D-manno-octulosonic-acid transferase
MRMLYNAALLPVRAASYVFGVWPRGSPEAELERDQRLGRRLPAVRPGGLWIHGASVGEARLIGALARELRRLRPALVLEASAVTATGRAQLPAPPAVDAAFFLPLDFPSVQRRAFDALSPSMIVLVETELWPNLLTEAERRGLPVVIVNGRLAPERIARYRRLSGLYRPLLRGLDAVGAAGRDEANRFVELGVSKDAVHVLGNLKFDLPEPAEKAADLRVRFGLAANRPIVAAGSTGEGEDRLVLEAFAAARREVPDLLLVLAPRHPERFASVADEAARRGFVVSRLSRGAASKDAEVLLVDTMGQLAALYMVAGSAFVGGSLVPVGGHNLLEPIAAGVPVLFGPHTEHVAEIAAALAQSGAGIRVEDAESLGRSFAELALHAGERARRVALGRAFVDANRGALRRAADLVLEVWDRRQSGRSA